MKCNRMSDGKYTIERHVRGLGGGLLGATAGTAVGIFLGNLVVFTGVAIVSGGAGLVGFCVGGPFGAGVAASATAKSLTITVVPLAQPFINSLAIGCGIAGGVAIGPV